MDTVMEITVGQIFTFLGVQSVIAGLVLWAVKRMFEKREKKKDKRDQAVTDILVSFVMCSKANLTLAEATAKAVQRIPEAHCNGDMEGALKVAQEMSRKTDEMITKIGVNNAVA